MTSRREDNVVRGMVYAAVVVVPFWLFLIVAVVAFVMVIPQSVGLLLAAGLILGPLLVWAFRRT